MAVDSRMLSKIIHIDTLQYKDTSLSIHKYLFLRKTLGFKFCPKIPVQTNQENTKDMFLRTIFM